MAVRDKAELKTQITDLIDSGGTPRISAANLRSVLDDLVDSLMLEPAHAASVTRYFGWSDDQVIATADLSSADESTSNVGEMPARSTYGYFYAAVPEDVGEPASLWLGDTALFATPSSRQAGISSTTLTVTSDNEVDHGRRLPDGDVFALRRTYSGGQLTDDPADHEPVQRDSRNPDSGRTATALGTDQRSVDHYVYSSIGGQLRSSRGRRRTWRLVTMMETRFTDSGRLLIVKRPSDRFRWPSCEALYSLRTYTESTVASSYWRLLCRKPALPQLRGKFPLSTRLERMFACEHDFQRRRRTHRGSGIRPSSAPWSTRLNTGKHRRD